jgi:outer membrane phospholipase A
MHRLMLVFLLMVFAESVQAQGLTTALVVSTAELSPGARVEVGLVILNPCTFDTRVGLPMELHARLVGEGQIWPVKLDIVTMPASVIAPGAFSHATCVFVVPLDAKGRLVLEVEEPAVRAVIDVKRPSNQETIVPADLTVPSPLTDKRTVPAVAQFHRVFAENISPHLPIYFIGGPEKPAVKFQFSFKYRVYGDTSSAGTLNPPLSGLFVGYTQRSIWDITSDSSPFYDSSYMPELMYESLAPAPAKPGFLGLKWYGYQTSIQHESNGKDGADSRSMNLFYVRPIFGCDLGDKWMLMFAPKMFVYIDNLSDNPDLPLYRGYGEYMMGLARKESWSLTALGRIGSHFDRGSIQMDFTYPLHANFGNFASFILVQYFNGYGESLLSYDQKGTSLRAGFSLVR